MALRKPLNTISANSLFHFTKGLDRIESILENGLYPRYHRELFSNIFDKENPFHVSYIPMVCFCDIPLSLIKDHIKDYGSYGIGLRKIWGIQNNICPIIYVDRRSSSAFHIRKLNENLTTLISDYKNSKSEPEKDISNILLDIDAVSGELLNISKYVKPYKGNFKKEVKIFYNEREWRYVPKGGFPTLRRGNYKRRSYLNILLKHTAPLKFKAENISYIILKKNKDIIKMVNLIYALPEDKYTETEKKILSTKIITTEQLGKDF